jgi:hypothetical protein
MRSSKKAMELSINFIVMLIIALVIFGMGLVLFKKFFVEAENIKQNLDEQTTKELQAKMMASSEQVIVYPTSFNTRKGQGDVAGVGILNIGTDTQFTIKSEFIDCYNREGNSMNCNNDPKPIGLYDQQNSDGREVAVQPNKREIFNVPFKVSNNVASGKYSVKISVYQGAPTAPGSLLGSNLIYIDVN